MSASTPGCRPAKRRKAQDNWNTRYTKEARKSRYFRIFRDPNLSPHLHNPDLWLGQAIQLIKQRIDVMVRLRGLKGCGFGRRGLGGVGLVGRGRIGGLWQGQEGGGCRVEQRPALCGAGVKNWRDEKHPGRYGVILAQMC